MSLHNLLRSVADGLRGGQQATTFEYCHEGHTNCELYKRCPVERNQRRCPDHFERWATWQVRAIWTDPVGWAGRAQSEITDWDRNPGKMMLYSMIHDLGGPELEGPELDFFRARLGEVLAAWVGDGWLARFAEQAHEREARNPTDRTLTDIAETVDAVLALADSLAEYAGLVNNA